MGKRDEAYRLLIEERLTPGEIAKRQGVTLVTILGYLDQLVGRGRLRRSDIYFSIPKEIREPIIAKLNDGHSRETRNILNRLATIGSYPTYDDLTVVKLYFDAGTALGEMYSDIRDIEVGLHKLIRTALQDTYGKSRDAWWHKGIPVKVKKQCIKRRSGDNGDGDLHLYCYTTVLDLKTILEENWDNIKPYLPEKIWPILMPLLTHQGMNEKEITDAWLKRFNQIRNQVMHPVKGLLPTEQDFEFIHYLRIWLGFYVTKNNFLLSYEYSD